MLERLPDVKPWVSPKPCPSPEHKPPGMIVLEPGRYKHTCPLCGKVTFFRIPEKSFLKTGSGLAVLDGEGHKITLGDGIFPARR